MFTAHPSRFIVSRLSPTYPTQHKTVMSVSIEDLVASLSSNHIGQEALDLAALQVVLSLSQLHNWLISPHTQSQLTQSLLTHQFSPAHTNTTISRRDPGHVQHCTTPTARTPSSSFVWPDHTHSRRSSTTSVRMRHSIQDGSVHLADLDDMDDEDALAVEAMILPSDSGALCASPSAVHASLNMWTQHTSRDAYNVQMTSPVDASLFTTTDPFYIQASQNEQPPHPSSTSTGFFALAGRPNAHSPFVMSTPAWQR